MNRHMIAGHVPLGSVTPTLADECEAARTEARLSTGLNVALMGLGFMLLAYGLGFIGPGPLFAPKRSQKRKKKHR